MTYLYQGRLYFVYSSHNTRAQALDALEDYYAAGEICAAERPLIRLLAGRFRVLFPAE